jgi:hypothetical protein
MRLRPALLVLMLALAVPSAAAADGLPTGGIDVSRKGLDDGAGSRYVTFAVRGGTVVARTDTRDGTIDDWFQTRGRFTIPAVAYDRTPSGLSADGDTLVLINPRLTFPRRQSSFYVVDTEGRLTPEGPITLKGDFSFDAISPDGQTMYLIRYLSPRDQTRYEVRAYDLVDRRLLPGPIVDPAEPDERMAGIPISRATSPDGRWAYTFYDGVGHEPFIHALDTEGRKAVCVDLPLLEGRTDVGLMRLDVDPASGAITVLSRAEGNPKSKPVAFVNPRSFAVTNPNPPAEPGGEDGASFPAWWLIALGVAGFGVALLLASGFPRRRPAPEPTLTEPLPVLEEDPDHREPVQSGPHSRSSS